MNREFEEQLQEYVVGPQETLQQYSHCQRNFTKDEIAIITELLLSLYERAGLLKDLKDIPVYSDKVRAMASWLLMKIRGKADNRTVPDINTQDKCFVPSGSRNMTKGKGLCWIVGEMSKRASSSRRFQEK